MFGAYSIPKGAKLIENVLRLDQRDLVEFHVFAPKALKTSHPGLIVHKAYHRDEIAELTARIRPHLAAVLSIWPETYSHSLSESWAMGLPVLATDFGAVAERIRTHGGGWLVPADPGAILEQLQEIAVSHSDIEARALEVAAWQRTHCGTPEISRMAESYHEVYRNLLEARPKSTGAGGSYRTLRIGLALKERRAGRFYATAHVRLLTWLQHPSIASAVELHRLFGHCFQKAELASVDLVIAQRDALAEDEAQVLLDSCAELNIPFLYEIDDNLLDVPASIDPEGTYHRARDAIKLQLRCAAAVLTSTPVLRQDLLMFNSNVIVHSNAVDEFHLLSRTGPSSVGLADPAPNSPIDCLFMGTATHAEDLEFCDSALEQALAREPRLRFTSVGCRPPSAHWQSLAVPSDLDYPAFCTWLREQAPRFAFAVAPLLNTPFNRRKSSLKFLEYAAIGLPGAFSRLDPFVGVVEHEHTGFLVENTPAAWANAIVRLAQDTELRRRMARQAYATIVREHLVGGRAGAFLSMLESLAVLPDVASGLTATLGTRGAPSR
jgi:glycosyltransferase involved in cell wall biosynthesis